MYEYVSIQDFKKLEEKVNKLLTIHEQDLVLTSEERQLIEEVKNDIKNKKKDNFVSVDTI